MSKSKNVELLVRAFKTAWVEYYQSPDRDGAISKESARPALAQFLVDKSREGLTDETALAVAGLEFLLSLEAVTGQPVDDNDRFLAGAPSAPSADANIWSLRLENASAQFATLAHVRVKVGPDWATIAKR
jgi:hypothetical protein